MMSTAPFDSPVGLESLKSEANRLTVIGFLLAIVGLLAMASPLLVGISVSICVGVLLTASGLGQVFFAMQSASGSKRLANIAFGSLSALCGILMVSQPMFGVKFMTILLIAFFLLAGIGEILHALQLRPAKGWGLVLASGVVSLLLAIAIWRNWPLSGAWAIGVLVGVKLMVCGVALSVLGLAARTMIHEEQASL